MRTAVGVKIVFKEVNEKMLFERTQIMLRVALREFAKGKVFMAIGASHLPGERGLLQGLVDNGYDVSPIFLVYKDTSLGPPAK